MKFDVKSDFYTGEVELVEVDDFGYDIYIPSQDDPINLGDVAYFDSIPTEKDVNEWLSDFAEVQ